MKKRLLIVGVTCMMVASTAPIHLHATEVLDQAKETVATGDKKVGATDAEGKTTGDTSLKNEEETAPAATVKVEGEENATPTVDVPEKNSVNKAPTAKINSAPAKTTTPAAIPAAIKDVSLDSWMPDKNFQRQMLERLGVTPETLQAEMMNHGGDIGLSYEISTLKGIEYWSNFGSGLGMAFDGVSQNTAFISLSDITKKQLQYSDWFTFSYSKNNITDASDFNEKFLGQLQSNPLIGQIKSQSIYLSNQGLADISAFAALERTQPSVYFRGSESNVVEVNGVINADKTITIDNPIVVFDENGNAVPFAGKFFASHSEERYVVPDENNQVTWDPGFYGFEDQGLQWSTTLKNIGQVKRSFDFSGRVNVTLQGNVKVQYVDETGAEIHADQATQGDLASAYDVTGAQFQLDLPGYELDREKLPNNATGTFSEDEQTVTYTYKKAPAQAGDVTIHYEDATGKTLASATTLSGKIGDTYQTEAQAISGYELITTPTNASGIFAAEAQSVTYIYKKLPVAGAAVTISYQDEAGKTLAPDVVVNGNVGDAYSSEQLTLAGYTFKKISGAESGTIYEVAQHVIYVYAADEGESVTPTPNPDPTPTPKPKPTPTVPTPSQPAQTKAVNKKQTRLPQTGERTPLSLTLLGGVILSGAAWLSLKKWRATK